MLQTLPHLRNEERGSEKVGDPPEATQHGFPPLVPCPDCPVLLSQLLQGSDERGAFSAGLEAHSPHSPFWPFSSPGICVLTMRPGTPGGPGRPSSPCKERETKVVTCSVSLLFYFQNGDNRGKKLNFPSNLPQLQIISFFSIPNPVKIPERKI